MDRDLPEARALAYAYPIQPGTYTILRLVHRFTEAPYIEIFGILSALGALAYLLVASALGGRVCDTRWLVAALLLLSAQEMTAAGWYANSSALAAALMTGAILINIERLSCAGLLISSALIAFAGWIRMDSLLISPVIFAAAYNSSQNLTAAFKWTGLIAAASIALLALLLLVSHTSFIEAWKTYHSRDQNAHWNLLVRKGWLATSGVMTLAGAIAWMISLAKRQWKLLAICLCGALPSLAVYGPNLASTKYLYYAVPFLLFPLIPALAVKKPHAVWRKGAAAFLLIAVLAEALIGVRTTYVESRRFIPGPWLIAPVSFDFGGRSIQLGIGEGEIVGTDDAFRIRTGWAFASRAWKSQKRRMESELALLHDAMRQDSLKIITTTYLSQQVVIGQLLEDGFFCDPPGVDEAAKYSFTMEWRKGERKVQILGVADSPQEQEWFSRFSAAPNPKLFVNDRGRNVAHDLNTKMKGWDLLSPDEDGLITIYGTGSSHL